MPGNTGNTGSAVAALFSKNLVRARAKAQISQEELAGRAEVHRTQIGLLEAAKRGPRLETVIKLAGALEVDPCDLISGIRWKPPSGAKGKFETGKR